METASAVKLTQKSLLSTKTRQVPETIQIPTLKPIGSPLPITPKLPLFSTFTGGGRTPSPSGGRDPFIFIPKLPGGGGGYKSPKLWRSKSKPKSKYTPSLVAMEFKIKGKKPRLGTGLSIRPINF